jgi:hypothetical protein
MTRRVMDQDGYGMKASAQAARLESPSMAGFHHGVKSCSLIGRKLGTMFEVPRDTSDAIDALLRELDRKIAR